MHIRLLPFCFSVCKTHKDRNENSSSFLGHFVQRQSHPNIDVIGQFGFAIWESNSYISLGDEKVFFKG